MKLFGWFRKPAPTMPRSCEQDNLVMAAWGLSQEHWAGLTWSQRAHYRSTFITAPHIGDVL